MRSSGNDAYSLTTSSEAELVDAAKLGEHPAYAELCRRHSHVALCMIQRITRNREDSEDVLQETLLRAFLHLDKFDGRSTFSTWLTRIAINSALMAIRKRRTRPGTAPENSVDCAGETWRYPQLVDPAPNPERHCVEREAECKMRQAVSRLPPILRNVIEIRYAQELSVAEVAEQVGISVAAAKSRLLRARVELQTKMTGTRNGSAAIAFRRREERGGGMTASRRMLIPSAQSGAGSSSSAAA